MCPPTKSCAAAASAAAAPSTDRPTDGPTDRRPANAKQLSSECETWAVGALLRPSFGTRKKRTRTVQMARQYRFALNVIYLSLLTLCKLICNSFIRLTTGMQALPFSRWLRLLNRREWKHLKGCVFLPPSIRQVPARGREARKRNPSITSIPIPGNVKRRLYEEDSRLHIQELTSRPIQRRRRNRNAESAVLNLTLSSSSPLISGRSSRVVSTLGPAYIVNVGTS